MRNGKVVVYASLVADLLHIGHLKLLEQAKALGDYLIVGVVTDDGCKAYKRKPIIPYAERVEMIKAIKYVDEVVSQGDQDPTGNLKADPSVDILVHADDWDDDYPAFEYMRSIGKRAVRVKYYKSQSTTKIIEKIRGCPDVS